jgi:glycosyltransferase involved in cell wall biosynthesis
MNTIPFGAAFYAKKRTVLLTYQLARRVWFYQMVFPFSLFGYLLEPIYLFVLSRKTKQVLTESESTRQDLENYGFPTNRTHVFRVGMRLTPLKQLGAKPNMNTVLFLGALRPMKRTLDAVKGFEYARDTNDQLQLQIAGDNSSSYGRKVMNYIQNSRHKNAIQVLGRVTNEDRLKLMQAASVIVVTSVKEGWGLIVTEANSQGTPAVAYDTDGLRDSVQDGKTGSLVPSGNTKALGRAINSILSEPTNYTRLRHAAWSWSKDFTFNNSYQDFLTAIKDTGQ